MIRGKTETAAQIILPEYDAFKTFAHMPVAIYLILGPPGVGELDVEQLEQLCAYRAKFENVENNFEQIGLKGANLAREKRILDQSKSFLDHIIQKQSIRTLETGIDSSRVETVARSR